MKRTEHRFRGKQIWSWCSYPPIQSR